MLPNTETNCPMNSRRKSRFLRRGPRSMNIGGGGRGTLAARLPAVRKKRRRRGRHAPRNGAPPSARFAAGGVQVRRPRLAGDRGPPGAQRQDAVAAGGEEQEQE